jgi:uncharacterized damage-inducible protein DinB
MKKSTLLFLLALPLLAPGQTSKPPTTLRGVLLEQLHSTYDQEDWFVPAKIAVADLTVDQAKWTPAGGGHSVGQLAYHLWFWDARALATFNGEKVPDFTGNNDETFNNFSAAQWADLVIKLNKVMSDWDTAVENAGDEKLAANASLIAHVSAHNAYHIGQILYVRKLEGAWDPSKGVK